MIRQEIVKQYVATLKEDGELDYIFPLLLERMGYRILSTPKQSKGQSQYGRDVIATKKIKGKNTLFLFELKGFRAHDITDRTLTEKDGIIDSLKASKYTKYRDASIPGLSKYVRKYVFVHNGCVDANALLTWNDFVRSEFPDDNLERWDLAKLTSLFVEYLFDETLLADDESYRLFKRALVLLDAEGNDYSDIVRLVDLQIEKMEARNNNHRAILNFFATLRLIVSMVYYYSKESDNLYPAKYCIDTVILKTWAWILKKGKEKRKAIVNYFNSLVLLQLQIYEEYVNKIIQLSTFHKGLFGFVPSDTEYIFYPLRCYEFQGDLVYFFILSESYSFFPKSEIRKRIKTLKEIIKNNNACTTPLLDTHSIPILMIFRYLCVHLETNSDKEFIVEYVMDTIINLTSRYSMQKMWPEVKGDQMALAKSLYKKSDDYCCSSSVLLLVIFEMIAYLQLSNVYLAFKKIVEESGVNLQVTFPNHEECDIEQIMFEHRLDNEVSVQTNINLPATLDDFRKSFKKKYKSFSYRTDKANYGFLRILAHKYYKTDMFPDFLGREFCIE